MLSKPVIGINTDFRAAKGTQPAYSLITAGYFDSILRAGGIPVLCPPMAEEDDINGLLDKLDGFMLSAEPTSTHVVTVSCVIQPFVRSIHVVKVLTAR